MPPQVNTREVATVIATVETRPKLEYPSVYVAADRAALRKQKWYFWSVRVELSALVVAAIPAGLALQDWLGRAPGNQLAGFLTAGFLVIGLVARLFRFARKFEERWFESRALAESVKVETWRFVMRAEPYQKGDGKAMFAERLAKLAESARDVFGDLDEQDALSVSHVTDSMAALRVADLKHRRERYVQDRVAEQQRWYRSKAAIFDKRDSKWATAAHLFEGAAVLYALVAAFGGLELGIMGVLTTFAAALAAWIQSKDFRRLATTYNLVAHDLTTIATVTHPQTEPGLRSLVDEVERTLSREHTLWLDRRVHH